MDHQNLVGLSQALQLFATSKIKLFEGLDFRNMIEVFFNNGIDIYIEVYSALAFPAFKCCKMPSTLEKLTLQELASKNSKPFSKLHIPKTINYFEQNRYA